jgi:hypothetical protein
MKTMGRSWMRVNLLKNDYIGESALRQMANPAFVMLDPVNHPKGG